MNRPWMPLYVGQYLADTTHLTTAEHGAYLLLIMHYWMNDGLPTDDRQLARIARMTPGQWKNARPVVNAFFQDGWKHKRIEFEFTEAARMSAAGKAGGRASAQARRQRSSNDKPTIVQPSEDDNANDPPTDAQALPLQERKEDAANAAFSDFERDYFRRGKEILGASAGGLLVKLLQAKKKNVHIARAALEMASEKHNPREYVGAVIAGGNASADGRRLTNDEIHFAMSGIPGVQ